MGKKVVLEGCLGDWSKKSYIKPLAEKAKQTEKCKIKLYAVDVRDIKPDEDKAEYYESPVIFVNKESKEGRKKYDTIRDVDFVFIVAPHRFHCKIAEHWLKEGKLKENGKIFIEKPLDSSVENIKDLEEEYGKEKLTQKIFVIDHYIPKIFLLIKKLREINGEETLGKIKKIKFNILESDPILESRIKTLDEGLILDMFPHVLAVFTKIMEAYSSDKFELNADDFHIIEAKTAKYKGAKIKGETFAKIVIKTNNIIIESCIGKAVGLHDNKKMEVFLERGAIKADFISGDFSIRKEDGRKIEGDLQKDPVNALLDDILNKRDRKQYLSFIKGYEIVKIISRTREEAYENTEYKKSSSPNKILRPREFDSRDKASIDVLLKQYKFLRDEITQCIYLEHAAILALYTFLGLTVAALIGKITECKFELPCFIENLDLHKTIVFVLALILAQLIVNGFGSLFLKEQARNRRACSFLRAIEYLINKKIGEIGIYWENYMISRLIDIKLELSDFIRFETSINPQYYKNRALGVGLPVFIPNLLITSIVGYAWYTFCEKDSLLVVFLVFFIFAAIIGLKIALPKYPFIIPIVSILGVMTYAIIEWSSLRFFILFFVSFLMTFFWALMIMLRSSTSLKKEKVPERKEVLEWLEEERKTL